MFSDFCLSSLLICIIVIIGDRPTGLYYNFCLSSLMICITEVITVDRPTGLYFAYRFDVCSWELRPSKGRELFQCLVDFAGIFEC